MPPSEHANPGYILVLTSSARTRWRKSVASERKPEELSRGGAVSPPRPTPSFCFRSMERSSLASLIASFHFLALSEVGTEGVDESRVPVE